MREKLVIDLRLYSEYTGIGLVTKKMYQYIPRSIFDVYVILNSEVDFIHKEDKVYFVNGLYGIVSNYRVYLLLKKYRPKYIIYPHYFVGLFIPRDVNVVSFVHDIMAITHNKVFWDRFSALKSFVLSIYLKKVLKNATLLVPSRSVQREIKNLFAMKSYVIPNGTDMGVIKNKLGVSLDYFLFVGNNRKHKNLPFLIDVVSKSFFKLNVISKFLVSPIPNIILKSNLSESELLQEYSFAKGLIFPSFCEGFGIPVIDSLKLKTPVIISRIDVFKEFYGLDVRFFNPFDKEELLFNLNSLDQSRSRNFSLKLDELPLFDWSELRYFINNLK